ncbi:molybdate ABC transporter substrate-binding protein [Evansella cellulosilytica]|nr:molybdate ABC transporter substrate-binding protein [Evansella cellulosilytica]
MYMLSITIFLLFISCSSPHNSQSPNNELTIAAAANKQLAFTEIGRRFEEETGTNVTFSFGSSGQLAEQIENGAPFDIFAAANIDFVDRLREQDLLIQETETTYAYGRIGVATLPNTSFSINHLDDLLQDDIKRIAIANPDHAPYGLAAKETLVATGLWEDVESKLVYGRNINDTLTFIETGNAEAGIIALSLYKEEKMDFFLIDDQLHEPLEHVIAVINRTNAEELAREFISFIKGPIGKPIMESYGFVVPEGK